MTKNKVWKLLGNIIFYAVLITLIAISGFSLNSVRKGVQPSFFGYKFFKLSFGFIISFKVGFELIGQFYIINTYIFNNSAYLN